MANTFNVQPKNLVFASPDGANGEPSFRALTANDVPSTGVGTFILPTPIVCANGFDKYVGSVFLPANTITRPVAFKMIMAGVSTSALNNDLGTQMYPNGSVEVFAGINGSNADTIVFSTLAESGGALNFFKEIYASISANGANSLLSLATSAGSNGAVTTATVDLTRDLYLGLGFNAFIFNGGHNVSNNQNTIDLAIINQIR